MEDHRSLDAAGAASARRLIVLLIFLFSPVVAGSQTKPALNDDAAAAKRLADAGQWEELLRAFPASPGEPAEIDFYRGLALAHTGRLDDARAALTSGGAKAPRDKRFPIELAGIAYKQKQFPAAKSELRRALALDPRDSYANDFLGSIYFLEGNTEATLKYWNRIGKPRLADLSYQPTPSVKQALLDRAFRFSLGQQWTAPDYLRTAETIRNLGIFSNDRYDLAGRDDGSFDLNFHATERNGWGNSTLAGLVTTFRGLPVLTITPEFSNLHRSAISWNSLFRVIDQRRRLFSEVSMPLGDDPALRVRFYFDGRNENWDISSTILTPVAHAAGLNLERAASGAELHSIVNGRWNWTAGLEYSYRQYRNAAGIPASAPRFFEDGSELHYFATVEHSLYRLPERRLTLDAGATVEFGTHFGTSLGGYTKLRESARLHWYPRARGDNDEVESLLRLGRTFGGVSFDELYMLGFERDNDLWLRGHPGLNRGRKGSAPLGRNYLLWNSDYQRRIYQNRYGTIRLGPFLDLGHITDPSGVFGSPEWLWDMGLEMRVRVFGRVEFILGYGHDLRHGTNSVFSAPTTLPELRFPNP